MRNLVDACIGLDNDMDNNCFVGAAINIGANNNYLCPKSAFSSGDPSRNAMYQKISRLMNTKYLSIHDLLLGAHPTHSLAEIASSRDAPFDQVCIIMVNRLLSKDDIFSIQFIIYIY